MTKRNLDDIFPIARGKNFYYRTILSFQGLTNSDMTRDLFKGHPEIEYLCLGHNEFTELPEDLFYDLPNLEYVDFYENKLTSLPPNLFKHSPKLKKLSIGLNQLTHIPIEFFENNKKLEIISFSMYYILVDMYRVDEEEKKRLYQDVYDKFNNTNNWIKRIRVGETEYEWAQRCDNFMSMNRIKERTRNYKEELMQITWSPYTKNGYSNVLYEMECEN